MRRMRHSALAAPTAPRAIDPASGFDVPHSDLVRQWDGEMIARQFVDKRNPQDFVKQRNDRPLHFARSEPPDSFIAEPFAWEDGRLMTTQAGELIITEGIDPRSTL